VRIRVGVLLVSDGHLALIKRLRAGLCFFVIPGGGLHDGEFSEQTAVRESKEELGVEVQLGQLAAVVERVEQAQSHVQLYYHAKLCSGVFGSGTGEEFSRPEDRGHYEAVWLPFEKLSQERVYPKVLATYLAKHGLPEQVQHFKETNDYPKV